MEVYHCTDRLGVPGVSGTGFLQCFGRDLRVDRGLGMPLLPLIRLHAAHLVLCTSGSTSFVNSHSKTWQHQDTCGPLFSAVKMGLRS